jgi:hypothetical protein
MLFRMNSTWCEPMPEKPSRDGVSGARKQELRLLPSVAPLSLLSSAEEDAMANPGIPAPDPLPGSNMPNEVPPGPLSPDEMPDAGPTGPRTPYPVDDPDIDKPKGLGSEPDYLPGIPGDPGTRF